MLSQQTEDTELMLDKCWYSVHDVSPTLPRHYVNVCVSWGGIPVNAKHLHNMDVTSVNSCLMLGQIRSLWTYASLTVHGVMLDMDRRLDRDIS